MYSSTYFWRKGEEPVQQDWRYFLLVVALQVQAQNQTYLVAAHSSERIIVRVINITLLYNK
ncbi:hypothetical protein AB205_0049400 [Aquarana catesbeiana]|uniref:Uncharacterized protein n=1 Tax=Aquarana catesbeiana TaxID=8400 RepID=A0A2G9RWZ4_AQUCT|nr:hypothetical protein AB205_0049400 [Aquarana catesbeiana]